MIPYCMECGTGMCHCPLAEYIVAPMCEEKYTIITLLLCPNRVSVFSLRCNYNRFTTYRR